jgi:hypothetical protein
MWRVRVYSYKRKYLRYVSFDEEWVQGTWDGGPTVGDYPHNMA